MKKKALLILATALLLIAAYLLGSGFMKQGAVYVYDFSLSPDGKNITLNVGISSSAGYVRKLEVKEQHGGKMYIDCYSAFGGINGSFGAETTYTLPLDESTSIIAMYRNTDCYEEVLKKNADGVWALVR